MSQLYVCSACKAAYVDVQRDGTLYFHACPPLFDDTIRIASPQPNGRDENVALRADGRPSGIKAEGLGVKAVDAGKAATPAWQQALAARVRKQEEE